MRANFVMSGVTEGLRRNLLMTVALILTTAVSLTFVAAAILTGVEINRFRSNYENKLNVSIYLCDSTKTAQCSQAVTDPQRDALQQSLSADSRVSSVSFVTYEQAYQNGLKTFDPAVAKFIQVGDIPSYFSIKLKDIKRDYPAISARYAKAAGVDSVQNEDESIKTILRLFSSAQIATIVAAAVILLSAIIMIAITIQVAAAQRRNETSIMRLVGASRWMTQLPFMIEAVIAAAIGGVIAVVIAWVGKHYILNVLLKTSVDNQVIPDLGTNDVLIAGGISLIAGIVLAGVTAYTTLRLYVRL
jgi:cell division transport system permease protein